MEELCACGTEWGDELIAIIIECREKKDIYFLKKRIYLKSTLLDRL